MGGLYPTVSVQKRGKNITSSLSVIGVNRWDGKVTSWACG